MRREAGAARYDDALVTAENVDGVFRLSDLGSYTQTTYFGGDEVGVLPTEVDDGNGVVVHGPRFYHEGSCVESWI